MPRQQGRRSTGGSAAVDVEGGEGGGVAFREVEAPPVEAHGVPQPFEPMDELHLDAEVGVVDVGSRAVVRTSVGSALGGRQEKATEPGGVDGPRGGSVV